MAAGPLLGTIGQIHISVTDIDRAVNFYRYTLGLPFLFQVSGQPMAFFQCGEVRLYLGVPERKEFRSNPTIYYRVASVQKAYEELQGRGVQFRDEPHIVHRSPGQELWMTFFKDPDGNNLALMEERKV
jgi:catechol 2,3-dioxygenase-like lactoylglutathione lyase family enzyme